MSTAHWFEPIAAHLGSAYLRYSFTKGTEQEVDFLLDHLSLRAPSSILDVGCGPGRHAISLARRGYRVHGVDISQDFIGLATASVAKEGLEHLATFEQRDAREMPFVDQFDVVLCLCQGAFGLMRANSDDELVLAGFSQALQPGGKFALSAFNAYFAVKYHEEAEFDADSGVSSENTKVLNPEGKSLEFVLHTGCYTPRELRLMAKDAQLSIDNMYSVEPGAYKRSPVSTETPEFLVFGSR